MTIVPTSLESRLRLIIPAAVVVAVAACGDSNTTPTGTKPPTTTASFDTLSKGSIPSSGGTITVNKPGDPLNGLTMTVSSGAFSGTLNIVIGSSTNKNLPTANGIVPISPVVHVTGGAGYANGVITFKIPATVATNTFPVVVLYDSATKAIEPMTTIAYDGSSVTAMTGHLSPANALSPSAARVAGRVRAMANGGSSDSVYVSFGVYAIPTALLHQDWDTHFRPGINDWEIPAYPTEPQKRGTLLGVVATELWYFNTRASATPLNGRFPAVRNVPLSDTVGFHWASLIDNQVDNEYNSYASAAYESVNSRAVDRDTLQFDQIRASFALATLNGGVPLPVLVDLQSFNNFYYLIAYRTTGNQIYVADPVSPGDSTRFLQLGSGGMIPYVNPRYKPGVTYTTPIATSLAMAIPLPTLASSYVNAAAGTAGNSLFPVAAFYSWSGQLYDTLYVIDSLRFWAQCATCQYGFASTLSPAPAGNVASSFKLYFISAGAVTDSIGALGPNGLQLSSAKVTPGTQQTLGVPLASPDSAGASLASGALAWLGWQQITITNLQVTIAPNAPEVSMTTPQTFQVSVAPNLLPADVAYQWTFGDSTAQVTVQKSANVQHTYAKSGTLVATVQIIDNRNTQVIAQGSDTVTVDGPVELWTIQSFKYLYTLVNGVKEYASDSGVPKDSLAITIQPGTVPTLVALNGPPFNSNYPEAGFGFASPPDSAQQWASVKPVPLAISAPYPPLTVAGYTNTGTATSGTITGQAIIANDNGVMNAGYSVNLVKNGATLSGYIMLQGTGPIKGVTTTGIVVDSVVAVRVPQP
jgi:hypothetical protein